MKIKKTFQGSLPENRIFNTDSTSQTDTYSCDYINDSSVVVSATEPTTNRKKVWIQKGDNLFDKNDTGIVNNKCISAEGYISDSSVSSVTGFISVRQNSQYVINVNYNNIYTKRVVFYDESKNVLNSIEQDDSNSVFTFITPNNAKYIRTQFVTEQIDNTRIEQDLNKIYIKNENDVYEEFIKKEEITYSTSEQKIGTWIDGKPLYRKVYDNITINSSETIIASTSGINIKMIYGWLVGVSNGTVQPLGSYASMDTTHTSRVFCDNTYIKVQANSTYNTGTYKARVIVEYTKTTD